jgi:predicted amidohydrolase
MKIKLALVQMEIKEKNCVGNTEHGLQLMEEAAQQSDLVILPEIWTTGYSLGHLREEAVTLDSPLIRRICDIAAKYRCSLMPGSIPVRKGEAVYNMLLGINKDGRIVSEYGKAHLFGMFEEEKFFAPGNSFDIFDLDGICCGATICYDLRFPEFYRYLAKQGAQLIVCPAEWPSRRGDGFDLLSRARAFENHLFIAAVNCVGTFKGDPFYGHSRVIDPMNRIIAEGDDKERLIFAEIDLDQINKARKVLNALQDTRFTIDRPLS